MYTSPYAQRWQGRSLGSNQGPADPEGRDQAQGQARLLQLLGGIAPVAGQLIGGGIGGLAGGPAGALAGAGLGGAAGQGLQSLANYGADQKMQPYDEAQAKRMARQQQISSILQELRGTMR